MRYSQIVGPGFYNIRIPRKDASLVDVHFLAAAHHRNLSIKNDENSGFHAELYWKHIHRLFSIIANGEFKNAQDLSGRGFEKPGKWFDAAIPMAQYTVLGFDELLPDPQMFMYFVEDTRFVSGEAHPYDVVLDGHLPPSRLTPVSA